MSELRILGVLVQTRSDAARQVQDVLTKYGCSIRSRLGLHNLDVEGCQDCGLILLELYGETEECLRLENELWKIDSVKVQKMIF